MALDSRDTKARMMAEAEEVIDRMLAERSKQRELQLTEIERMVREAGKQVMERFTREMVADEAERETNNICPECGRKMRGKGRKPRDLVTKTGEVRLVRAHYYCPRCKEGVFPPRPTMESE
jgi:ribosomal protein S27AE